MPAPIPTPQTRWRCNRCGNLTRFDVVRSTRVREFVHLDLSGDPEVEETEVLAEAVESVRCRWCRSYPGWPRCRGRRGAARRG